MQSPRGVPLLKMVEVLFVGSKFSELMPLRELKLLKNNGNMELLQYFLTGILQYGAIKMKVP